MRLRLPRLRRRKRAAAVVAPAAPVRFTPAPEAAPAYATVPHARESVELVFRDGSRVQLSETEAAAFQRLAGGLASRDPHNSDTD